MTKTHRVITEEEYDTGGRLLHKTVTEETEEWLEGPSFDCPADCPGGEHYRFLEGLRKQYSTYPYTNPYKGGPSDSTAGSPLSTEYTTTASAELH